MVDTDELTEVNFGWRELLEGYLEWVKDRPIWSLEPFYGREWVPIRISCRRNGSWLWRNFFENPIDVPIKPPYEWASDRDSRAWMPDDQALIEHILKVKDPKGYSEYFRPGQIGCDIWLFRRGFRPWTSRANMNRHIDVIRAILEYR